MLKNLGYDFNNEQKKLLKEKNMSSMFEIKDYKQATDSLVWNDDRKSDPSVSAYNKNIGKKIFFKNSNKTVCVQYKFADFFGAKKEVFIKNPKSAVVIKEKNETVGYIMPIWIKASAAFERFKDENKEFFEIEVKSNMEQQLLRTCNALYAYSKIASKENLKDALIEQYERFLQKTKDFLKEEYNITNANGFIAFFNGFCFSQKER